MIVLGRISAPYGILGWVKVQLFGDDLRSLSEMPRWWLAAEENAADAAWQAKVLAECKPHGKGLVARFEGVGDRNAALRLTGMYLGAPREALPKPEQNEYYWADLIGLEVVNESGEHLGRVAELVRAGAHEVLDVRGESGTRQLMPFVAAVVKEVDVAAGWIRVDWGADW
ncbi:MAG: ribosome maturation factor RimM [Betaproteobacteria bacterium]|nr:ribosome maturation factor RimM [Betaproteobacteria bacterium]